MPIWLPKQFERPMGFKPKVKPTGEVEINWKHPLARGLTQALEFSQGRKDLVNADDLTLVGGAKLKNGALEIINTGDAATVRNRLVSGGSYHFRVRSYNTTAQYRYLFDTLSGVRNLFATLDNNLYLYAAGTNSGNTPNLPLKNSDYHSYVIIEGSNRVYVDGVFLYDYVDGAFSLNNTLVLGARYNYIDILQGDFEFFRTYDRALSDTEIKSLHDNPYQFLVPK